MLIMFVHYLMNHLMNELIQYHFVQLIFQLNLIKNLYEFDNYLNYHHDDH